MCPFQLLKLQGSQFLLLWLLNSVTQEQLEGISNYFAPASPSQTNSGSGGPLGGLTMTVDGAMQSPTSPAGVDRKSVV